jgi:hypothetical protein
MRSTASDRTLPRLWQEDAGKKMLDYGPPNLYWYINYFSRLVCRREYEVQK